MVNRRLMSTDDAAMGRDGTGNEIPKNTSNVLKLHLCLRKLDRTQPQHIALYDSGGGTVTAPVNNTPRPLTVR